MFNDKVEDLKQRNKNLNEKKLIIGKIIKIPYFAKTENCKKSLKKTKIKNNKKKLLKKFLNGQFQVKLL